MYNFIRNYTPRYISLIRNMFLTIITVSFVPVSLVSLMIYLEFRTSHREKIVGHLTELVGKHKRQIDNYLTARRADIRFVADSFGLDNLSSSEFLDQLLQRLQKEYGPVFVDLGVIDANGDQVSYAGPFRLGKAHYTDSPWYKQAMDKGEVVSDVFLGLRGLPHFIVAVKRMSGGVPWVLRATIDFVAFNQLVGKIRVGDSGFAFILNRQGEFQTTSHSRRNLDGDCFGRFYECNGDEGSGVRLVERKDEAGIDSLFVMALLKGGDWLLVYQQQTADAFSDLRRVERVCLLIFSLGGLGIVIMALVLSVRMADRIARSDVEKEVMNRQVVETGKMASLGELATGVAHEINNPVAIMIEEAGWIQDLISDYDRTTIKDYSEIARALKEINVQGRRCRDITKKLLSFARGSGTDQGILQLNQVIEDVIGLSTQRAKYANITIEAHLQQDLPKIAASETEMHQVFLNLVNNALYAMEKTGGKIRIASAVHDGHLALDVADTGPGIPKASLERIFEPFYTTKPVGQGTGLGLSICYGIIAKMNGKIEVESEVGKGALFRILLPINPPG